MSGEMAELRARIERLEAQEACRAIFNRYVHYVDGGFTDDLMELFVAEARLEIMNFPPGSGQNLEFDGPEAFRPLYVGYAGAGSRHHAANMSVQVDDEARIGELSAYFLTSVAYGLTGGIYEARLERKADGWRIAWMRISSTWGWSLPQESPPYLAEPFGAGTLRGGRPAFDEAPQPDDR